MRPEGGGLTRVVDGDGAIGGWSPDGRRLAVGRGAAVVALDVSDGDETALVSAEPFELDGNTWYPGGIGGWSPDGERILFVAEGLPDAVIDIFSVEVATGAVARLTVSPLFPPPGFLGGRTLRINDDPQWSPDGARIVFNCWPLRNTRLGEVCSMAADGGDVRLLTTTLPLEPVLEYNLDTPTWSPEGDRIAYTRENIGGDSTDIVVSAADGTGATTIAQSPGRYHSFLDWGVRGDDPPVPDADGDGVADAIDTGAGTFADGDGTSGSIVDTAGLDVLVEDLAAPDGVRITVGGTGTARATFSVCGFTLRLGAGSTAEVTCGSIIVEAVAGPAEVDLGGGLARVTIPEGSRARVSEATGGRFLVESLGGALAFTVDGIAGAIDDGGARTLAAWDFLGFEAPVDAPPTVNVMRAGRAVPLRWSLVDAAGRPVTGLTSARLTATSLGCSAGQSSDLVEETLAGGSGLRELGEGRYALNWKVPVSYAGSCKTLNVDVGDGVTHQALFRFTR